MQSVYNYRVETARQREKLLGVEERMEAMEERGEASLERMERAITDLKDSLGPNKMQTSRTSKRKHHSKKVKKSKT